MSPGLVDSAAMLQSGPSPTAPDRDTGRAASIQAREIVSGARARVHQAATGLLTQFGRVQRQAHGPGVKLPRPGGIEWSKQRLKPHATLG